MPSLNAQEYELLHVEHAILHQRVEAPPSSGDPPVKHEVAGASETSAASAHPVSPHTAARDGPAELVSAANSTAKPRRVVHMEVDASMGNAAAHALASPSDASIITAKDDRIVELRQAYSLAVSEGESLRSSLSTAHARIEVMQQELAVACSELDVLRKPACVDVGTLTSPNHQDIHDKLESVTSGKEVSGT